MYVSLDQIKNPRL